ncbi:MAG: DNA-binding protein [Desulfurococcales archaeon ex4484_204]|nr:MAG: DNA-binding protein [Desulfurococcales archaeon ex4484_204]
MGEESKITIGNKPLIDYIVSLAILFNQGIRRIIIRGSGDKISKAIAVYNALKERMGDAVKLNDVRIGSENRRGRMVSYIEIVVEKVL